MPGSDFLAILLVTAALGIAACIRRGAGRVTWILGVSIATMASAGVWKYIQQRTLSESAAARAARDVAAFIAGPPERLRATDTPRVILTWSVPCSAFTDSYSRDGCGEALNAFRGTRPSADPVAIRLTSVPRPGSEEGDRFLEYVLERSSAQISAEHAKGRLSMTIDAFAEPAAVQGIAPPFITVAHAEIRITLPETACPKGVCSMTAIRFLADEKWFCPSAISPQEYASALTFKSRLLPCAAN